MFAEPGSGMHETLMAYLPAYETIDVASKADIRRLEDRLDHLAQRLDGGLNSVNQRLDRFFITQSAGLIAMVGTLIAAILL